MYLSIQLMFVQNILERLGITWRLPNSFNDTRQTGQLHLRPHADFKLQTHFISFSNTFNVCQGYISARKRDGSIVPREKNGFYVLGILGSVWRYSKVPEKKTSFLCLISRSIFDFTSRPSFEFNILEHFPFQTLNPNTRGPWKCHFDYIDFGCCKSIKGSCFKVWIEIFWSPKAVVSWRDGTISYWVDTGFREFLRLLLILRTWNWFGLIRPIRSPKGK